MKRSVILVTALMLTLFSSCIRNEDLELLRHPIHVQGEVDPYFGVPIAYGELTLNDIYEMLNENYTGWLDPNEDVVTLVFDTTAQDVIYALGYDPSGDTAKMHPSAKGGAKGFMDFIDTTLEYSVDISLFDDARISSITAGNIAINHLWFNLDAVYQGHCQPGYDTIVQNHVRATADSLVIKYVGHDYITHVFTGLPPIEPITINTVLNRQTLSFDSIDLAPLINTMPRKIIASFRFKFSIDDSWAISNITNPSFPQMMDTIRMTYLEYDAAVSAAFPFEVHIGMLPYDFTIDLGDGLATVNIDSILNTLGDNVDAELKDSYINLAFDNGIPFDFMMSASMLDADSNFLFEVVNLDTVLSAPTRPMDSDPSTLEASGVKTTVVRALLNQEKLRKLKDARKMHFGLAISSGAGKVAVQRSNSLKIRASVQVHPDVSVDIPVIENPILH
ncbi:MAG: hypothetical protein IKR83_02910 [Bacteroidales bacterium]|nr:hypothetical protein [Bacteroidales bacterium]